MKRMRGDYKILLAGFVSVLSLVIICAFVDDGKSVYDTAIDKTVMMTVPTQVVEYTFVIKNGKLDIEKRERIAKIQGTGAFISPNGHILTCAHLFTIGKVISISATNSSGVNAQCKLIGIDEKKDLAVLQTDFNGNPYFRLATSLKVGETVFAVGNPLGIPFSVTQGIVSALHRNQFMSDMVQTDTAINPGNSGGPLVNLRGQLIGINSLIVPPVNAPIFTGIGMSISTDQIREFLYQFKGLGE